MYIKVHSNYGTHRSTEHSLGTVLLARISFLARIKKKYIDLIRETKTKMKYGTVTKFSIMDFVLQ